MPDFYRCQRCTACCRWPGQVRLTDKDVARLAAFHGLSEFEFIQRFTRLRRDRQGLALVEKPRGECVFLAANDCSVQSVKPQQCRDFPNLWRFPGFQATCRALAEEVSLEEYVQLVANATGRERVALERWLMPSGSRRTRAREGRREGKKAPNTCCARRAAC